MTERAQPPRQDCPKCGNPYGLSLSEPRYHELVWLGGDPRPERLSWSCVTCGYTVDTRCVDAAETTGRIAFSQHTHHIHDWMSGNHAFQCACGVWEKDPNGSPGEQRVTFG